MTSNQNQIKVGLLIVFSLIVTFFVAETENVLGQTTSKVAEQAFSDVSNSYPYAESLNILKKTGYIQGYGDGNFKPDLSITRGEFITMVLKPLIKADPKKYRNCFKDVKTQWFAANICLAKGKSIVSGFADGTFRPEKNISLAEAGSIMAKAYKLPLLKIKKGDPWFKPGIKALEQAKAIPVSVDYINKKLSRGETAEMVLRLKNKIKDRTAKTYLALTSEFPTLNSCDELKEKAAFLMYKESKRQRNYYYEDAMLDSVEAVPQMATGLAQEKSLASETSAATDYSQTNVQVEGVDEADIIKNDGEFIYIIKGNTVRIVKAYRPEELSEIANLKFSDQYFQPDDLYITDTKLIVLGSTSSKPEDMPNPEREISFVPYYSQKAKVIIVDMTDKQNLKEERSLEFDGYTISSRRIDNRIYLVTNLAPNYYYFRPMYNGGIPEKEIEISQILPRYYDSASNQTKPITDCVGIRFLPDYQEMNMLTIASIDLSNPESEISKETIMGTGNIIYSSLNNLYVAGTRYTYPEINSFDIWNPPTTDEKTIIYRFNLDNGQVVYKGQGEVKGHLLNQFSMDESGGAFRLATTTGEVWDSQNPSKNHLFILDRDNLSDILGKIEDIAPGEKIYSVRFMGDRAYMVTFKKVDPFFVIDVSDPKNPKILGALKIPGYSDYLHPYDENHIIGFGKETADPAELEKAGMGRDFDFAWYQGMKIAVFDVTDVANPKVLFKELIGDRGTESPLLYDHKALLFDKNRNLLAFPVSVAEIPNKQDDQYTGNQYGQTVFQGAYIYNLDLENGFQIKGKVTHFDDQQTILKQGMNWYDPNSTISRIIYIGDYLYTISQGKIKALSMDTIDEINKVELPDNGNQSL